MSISSPEPMNEETQKKMREAFGEPVSSDEKTALFNNLNETEGRFKDFAEQADQELKMQTFEEGDIKTLDDGTQYRVTNGGWVKIETTDQNEVTEARQFLDKNIFSLDKILELAELRKLLLWASDNLPIHSPLHIIVEDGNYDDSDVDFCSLATMDSYWREKLSPEDIQECKKIIKLLRPLTPEQREMVDTGTVITEDLHNLLYNQCAHGG